MGEEHKLRMMGRRRMEAEGAGDEHDMLIKVLPRGEYK